jgi:hypothetical protein
MVAVDGIVIALSQIERGIEVFGFGRFFLCREVIAYRILHGELNAYLVCTVWRGYEVEWLCPNSPHIHGWREHFKSWTARTKSCDFCLHWCVFWRSLSARQDKS